jgi:hypothetical protein
MLSQINQRLKEKAPALPGLRICKQLSAETWGWLSQDFDSS